MADAAPAPVDPPAPEAPAPVVEQNRFHVVLCVEGTWSGDKRYIDPAALTWRDLPLPMMAQDVNMPEHMESFVIGSLDKMERIGNLIHGYGPWSSDVRTAGIRQLVRDGHLTGVSADMDDVEYEVVLPAGAADDMMILAAAGDVPPDASAAVDEGGAPSAGDTAPPTGDVLFSSEEDPQLHVLGARIIGATVTPFPAFAECFIEDLDPTAALLASAAPVHATDTSEDSYNPADEVAKLADPLDLTAALSMFARYDESAVADNLVPVASCEYPHHFVGDDGQPAAASVTACLDTIGTLNAGTDYDPEEVQGIYDHVAAHLADAGAEVPALEPPAPPAAPPASVEAITAAARITPPVHPPAAWFANPGLRSYTPLTIGDDGRVFGHVAEFGVCHIGFPDSCVTAPRSASNYSMFHVGEVRTHEGTRIAVGHLALRGGHADEHVSAAQAKAFYDNTLSCIADLVVGEDRIGIWAAGALRPDVTPAQVRAAMASGVSGDWRRIRGAYELIQLSNVNVPGFNSPRARIREVDGLVASMRIDMPWSPPHERIGSAAERIAASIGRSTAQRRAALHDRVHEKVDA